jgi:hypothetical protein
VKQLILPPATGTERKTKNIQCRRFCTRQIDVVQDFNPEELGNYKNVHDTVTWLQDNRENYG